MRSSVLHERSACHRVSMQTPPTGSRAVAAIVALASVSPAQAAAVEPAFDAQLENLPILFQTERNGTFDLYAMDARGRRQRPVITGRSNDQDPDRAPSGSDFAFTSDRDGSWQIYVTGIDGTPRQLTSGPGSNVAAVWSPDGSQIAFETNRDGDWEIYVMDADGASQRNVSNDPSDDFDPTWQPDGAHVAFARVVGTRLTSTRLRPPAAPPSHFS